MSASLSISSSDASGPSAPSTLHTSVLESYQEWCRSEGLSDVIQYRGLAGRVEKYLSHQVSNVNMSWKDLKSLASQLCSEVDEQLQLGPQSAIKALFEVSIKNHCWKLTNKHNIKTDITTTVNASMEEDGLKHELDTQRLDSFDEHASMMNMCAFMGAASKIKMTCLVPAHFTDPPGAGTKKGGIIKATEKSSKKEKKVDAETGGMKRKSDVMHDDELEVDNNQNEQSHGGSSRVSNGATDEHYKTDDDEGPTKRQKTVDTE